METAFQEVVNKNLPKTSIIIGINNQKIKQRIVEYIKRVGELPDDYCVDRAHCVFDLIAYAEQGERKSISFLNFIDIQCFELYNLVNSKFKPKVKHTIIEMLLAMDTDINIPNNPAYKNFLAEIVGLLFLLTKPEFDYSLEAIEGSFSNGKSVDWVFKKASTNELIYIDVFSIHNIHTSKIESDAGFIKLIEDKISAKVASKTNDLKLNGNKLTINGKEITFVILPIIWCEISVLLPYKLALASLEKNHINALQCCSLHCQEIENSRFIYTFCTVNNILEDWEDQENNYKEQSK